MSKGYVHWHVITYKLFISSKVIHFDISFIEYTAITYIFPIGRLGFHIHCRPALKLVLCRDRFLAGRDKSRLGSKNQDKSRRDLRQCTTELTAQNSEK